VIGIQKKIVKQGKRNAVSRAFYAKNDKDTIAAWRRDLDRILHVFNVCSDYPVWCWLTTFLQTELAINTHTMVSDIHQKVLASREGNPCKFHPVNMARSRWQKSAYDPAGSSQVSQAQQIP
jgi:hypothetical protein